LGDLGDPLAVEPLILKAVRGYGGKEEAVRALGKMGDPRAVEPLIQLLDARNSNSILHTTAEALGKLGDPRAVKPLIQLLGDGDNGVRRAAAEALAQLDEPKWKEWVKGDEGDFTRLGVSGALRAAEPLIRALENRSSNVRRAAVEALGKLSDPRAVESLINALNDAEKDIRRAAAAALSEFASACPTVIGKRWGEVRELIRNEHQDNVGSDNRHCDVGIGLPFPDPPLNLDF
jgi:HEAT repeat protein